MVVSNTNECDADQGFLWANWNRVHSLVTILAVQRRAVDTSIKKGILKSHEFAVNFIYSILYDL